MQVVEKKHRIDVTLHGTGTDAVLEAIQQRYPDAEVVNTPSIPWHTSDLAADIHARRTPGKMLRAYRERAGMSLVELARAVGTKHPNISAMENDRRTIGLNIARRLADALGCDYTKFLGDPPR